MSPLMFTLKEDHRLAYSICAGMCGSIPLKKWMKLTIHISLLYSEEEVIILLIITGILKAELCAITAI